MDTVEIPEAIPEIGMEAGTPAVVDTVSEDGRRLLADASSPEPPSAMVDLEVGDDGSLRVVGYLELTT